MRSAKSLLGHYAGLWRAAGPEVRGILLMCVSTLGFAVMHTLIRYASAELHPWQIAFFRNVFGFLVFLPILMRSGFGFLRTGRLGLHAVRGMLNIAAMLMFFYALSIVEVARATALAFSAPIFTGILSVVFLGERFRIHRWGAIVAGFVGMLVILRPGLIPMELGPVLVIASSLLWATVMIIIKVMSRTESSLAIVAYMNIFLAIYSVVPAIFVWQWPTPEGWALMVAIGVTGTLGQLGLSQSLAETEPTVVMPFDFLRLIWVAGLGFWVFGEIPDLFVWLGGAIIFASGFYIAWRENRTRSAGGDEAPEEEERASAAGPGRSGPAPAPAGELGDGPERAHADQAGEDGEAEARPVVAGRLVQPAGGPGAKGAAEAEPDHHQPEDGADLALEEPRRQRRDDRPA
jgi:drug/metabolite transporter (DMT)-like permease